MNKFYCVSNDDVNDVKDNDVIDRPSDEDDEVFEDDEDDDDDVDSDDNDEDDE